MVEFLKAVLFGIVEGITEWLPISSTGHMILLNEFVKLEVSEEFWEMFLVVIQLGAILADRIPEFVVKLGKTVAESGLDFTAWNQKNPKALEAVAAEYL